MEIVPHPLWGQVTYQRSRKARQLRLSVQPFAGVLVILPWNLKQSSAEKLMTEKHDWILKTLEHAREVERRSCEFYADLAPLDRAQVKQRLGQRLDTLAREHGFSYGNLSLRDQKTRWGSCSSRNNISLNQKLIYLPDQLRDYVLLHELAHTREKNHGRAFWHLLYQLLGKGATRQARLQLKEYEFLFYPPETE